MATSRTYVGNLFLFRMGMRGLGALAAGLSAVWFGEAHVAQVAQVAIAVTAGVLGGVAGHFLGHFTARPDREIPAVDVLVRVMCWSCLLAGAVIVTWRWPAVGMAVWVMLTQAATPLVRRWLRPLWRPLRMEHVAPRGTRGPAAVREG